MQVRNTTHDSVPQSYLLLTCQSAHLLPAFLPEHRIVVWVCKGVAEQSSSTISLSNQLFKGELFFMYC